MQVAPRRAGTRLGQLRGDEAAAVEGVDSGGIEAPLVFFFVYLSTYFVGEGEGRGVVVVA